MTLLFECIIAHYRATTGRHRLGVVAGLVACALLVIPDLAGAQGPAKSKHQAEQASPADSKHRSADKLAAAIVARTGNPRDVDRLDFSFVVNADGAEKMRRHHRWWPKKGRLEVTSADTSTTLTHLNDYDLSAAAGAPDKHVDMWHNVAPNAPAAQAAKAWGWFVNDCYWLLAPAKLDDPGVNHTIDPEGRLVLTFGKVGMTPGDRYALTVDRDRAVITRWDFTLQSGKTGSFKWQNYRQLGPLYLSTHRPSIDGNMAIDFEDIRVQPAHHQ